MGICRVLRLLVGLWVSTSILFGLSGNWYGTEEARKKGEADIKNEEENRLTLLVPMRLHIPECMYILWIILLITSDFDLLESPLRQDSVRSP